MSPTTLDSRPPHHEFALDLERARREAGLKPKEIAQQLYVDPRTVRRYLNGERLPTFELTEAWEQVCDVEAGRLLRVHPQTVRPEPSSAPESRSSPSRSAARPRVRGRERKPMVVPGRWSGAYVFCVLTQFHRHLKRREIYANASTRWRDPRAQLLAGEAWTIAKPAVLTALSLPAAADDLLTRHARTLDGAYRAVGGRRKRTPRSASTARGSCTSSASRRSTSRRA